MPLVSVPLCVLARKLSIMCSGETCGWRAMWRTIFSALIYFHSMEVFMLTFMDRITGRPLAAQCVKARVSWHSPLTVRLGLMAVVLSIVGAAAPALAGGGNVL